jgi:hypothetical protein
MAERRAEVERLAVTKTVCFSVPTLTIFDDGSRKWKDLAAKQNAQRPARGSRNPTRGATFYEVYYDALFRDDDEGDADEGEVELGSRPLFRPNR